MFNKKYVLIGLVVLIVVFGYSFFRRHQSVATPTAPLTFGVIAGQTGAYAFVGESYVKGVRLAEQQWKQVHPNETINLVIEDDSFDSKKGLAAYLKLVNVDHVSALINMTSPTIDAIYSQVVETKLPVLQGGEQSKEPMNDTVFQILPGNVVTEQKLGEAVAQKGYKNVAVFIEQNATLIKFLDGFKKGYGGATVDILVQPGEKDVNAPVLKLVQAKPDAVLFMVTPPTGGLLVKKLREVSKDGYHYIFDANVQTGFGDYQKILGDTNMLNGSMVVMINQKVNNAFTQAYEDAYHEKPGIAADWAYDSFMLLAQTYHADRLSWVDSIKRSNFEGAGGTVKFDAVGVREPSFSIGTIQNGALPVIE